VPQNSVILRSSSCQPETCSQREICTRPRNSSKNADWLKSSEGFADSIPRKAVVSQSSHVGKNCSGDWIRTQEVFGNVIQSTTKCIGRSKSIFNDPIKYWNDEYEGMHAVFSSFTYWLEMHLSNYLVFMLKNDEKLDT
jgi:hypothetical protein